MIRTARADELTRLRVIEREAGSAFRSVDMDAIAEDEPPTLELLAVFQQDGRAWVYVDETDAPVAYLLVDVIDDGAHIEQVSVCSDASGRGLGRALIDAAAEWARQRGLTRLTLTTYRDVPWNAPYYQRIGFRVVDEDQLTENVRRLRAREAAHGLDRWPRVVMQRPLD